MKSALVLVTTCTNFQSLVINTILSPNPVRSHAYPMICIVRTQPVRSGPTSVGKLIGGEKIVWNDISHGQKVLSSNQCLPWSSSDRLRAYAARAQLFVMF